MKKGMKGGGSHWSPIEGTSPIKLMESGDVWTCVSRDVRDATGRTCPLAGLAPVQEVALLGSCLIWKLPHTERVELAFLALLFYPSMFCVLFLFKK
jgi:hypothetical protein